MLGYFIVAEFLGQYSTTPIFVAASVLLPITLYYILIKIPEPRKKPVDKTSQAPLEETLDDTLSHLESDQLELDQIDQPLDVQTTALLAVPVDTEEAIDEDFFLAGTSEDEDTLVLDDQFLAAIPESSDQMAVDDIPFTLEFLEEAIHKPIPDDDYEPDHELMAELEAVLSAVSAPVDTTEDVFTTEVPDKAITAPIPVAAIAVGSKTEIDKKEPVSVDAVVAPFATKDQEPQQAPEPIPPLETEPLFAPEPVVDSQTQSVLVPATSSVVAKEEKPVVAGVSFDSCYQKAEAMAKRDLWPISAVIFEESSLLADKPEDRRRALFAAMNSYVNAKKLGDVRRLAELLSSEQNLSPAQKMKLQAIMKMLK